MDASSGLYPPPSYSEGWPHQAPPYRPDFPSTSHMMSFHPSMNPNAIDSMPHSNGTPPMVMPTSQQMQMMQANGIFPPNSMPGPYGPPGQHFGGMPPRFPVGPGNFPHHLSPGFPGQPNGINSPSLNGPSDFPSSVPNQHSNSPFAESGSSMIFYWLSKIPNFSIFAKTL